MIKAKDALIVWEDDDKGRVFDVRVVGHEGFTTQENARGRCDAGWMKGDPHETPMGIFVMMVDFGFADRDALKQAATEFGRILECGWAREMAAVFGVDPPSVPPLRAA